MSNPNNNTQDRDMQGEGNRTADRDYREHATRHAQSGRSEKAATEAERAVEGEEGEALRNAEKIGKEGRPKQKP